MNVFNYTLSMPGYTTKLEMLIMYVCFEIISTLLEYMHFLRTFTLFRLYTDYHYHYILFMEPTIEQQPLL